MAEEIKTDYCIVGGGITGILLASKLASSGKKILVLDQGPRFSGPGRFSERQPSPAAAHDATVSCLR